LSRSSAARVSDRVDEIAARELTVKTDLDAVEVAGSPTLLRRMLENVIENAVRPTPSRAAWSRSRSHH
jgi:signal transduction histidine kinase